MALLRLKPPPPPPVLLRCPSHLSTSTATLPLQIATPTLLSATSALAELYPYDAGSGALPLDFFALPRFKFLQALQFVGLRPDTSYKARLVLQLKAQEQACSPFVFFTTRVSELHSDSLYSSASAWTGFCAAEELLILAVKTAGTDPQPS